MAKKHKQPKEYTVNIRLLFSEQITATSAEEAGSQMLADIEKTIHFSSHLKGNFEWEVLTIDSNEIK